MDMEEEYAAASGQASEMELGLDAGYRLRWGDFLCLFFTSML